MAYPQYTKCVKPSSYSGPVNFIAGGITAAVLGAVFLNVGLATFAALVVGIAYCRWWLYGRLVCLDGNKCAIGLALEVFPPEIKTGLNREDTDYSVNLLLAPTSLFEGFNQACQDTQGVLIAMPTKSADPDFHTMMSNHPGLGFIGEPEPFSGLINPDGQSPNAGIWQPNYFYTPGAVIQDASSNFQSCTTQGLSGGSTPAWAATVGGTTADGYINWVCTGRYSVLSQAALLNLGLVNPGTWAAATKYNVGDLILDSNSASDTQSVQSCITAGTSGSSAPTWADTFGAKTSETSSSVVWSCLGVGGRWSSSYLDSSSYSQITTTYKVGDQLIDGNGNLQQCTVAGSSGSVNPAWATAVGATTSDGQVTWKRVQNLGWMKNTRYQVGTQITDGNGNAQTCTTAGESGSTAPSWSTVNGQTTQDTAAVPATWTCVGESINAIGTLEVEFEGGGMYDLYLGLLAALPLAVVATAASAAIMAAALTAAAIAAATGPWGWLLALLIILIGLIASALASAPAAAAAGVGYLVGQADVADPAADDPNIGTIYPGRDVMVVMGTWIYDSAHAGWNELHPVLHCQKIAQVSPEDLASGNPRANLPQFSAANVETTLNQNTSDRMGWCPLIGEASAPLTVSTQGLPQNAWIIHPLVDGCTPPPPRLQ